MKLEPPLLVVNFKTYEEATGPKALRLAKICEEVAENYGATIVVCPQFCDIPLLVARVKIPIFAQHMDPFPPGAFTGSVSYLALKQSKVLGTLLNHSEKKLGLREIAECIKLAKREGLLTLCCAESLLKARQIADLSPDFLAYEPPELIGTGKSVSKAKAALVEEFVKLVSEINPKILPLCGAGVSNSDDVSAALKLGTKGVLVASAIVKATNQKKVVEEMTRALIF